MKNTHMKANKFFMTIFLLFSLTLNAQIVTSFPWSEDFEGTVFPPQGWDKETPDLANDITRVDIHDVSFGTHAVNFSSENVSTNYNQYLFSKQIHTTAPYTKLVFWAMKDHTLNETFEWGIATSQNSTSVTQWHSVSLTEQMEKIEVDISAYNGQDVYIAWHYFGDNAWNVYLEHVAVEEMPVYTMPAFTSTVIPDCNNNQYNISVNITDLGGATSLSVRDNVLGNITEYTATATGTFDFGPYNSGTEIYIFAENQQDTNFFGYKKHLFNCPPPNDDCDNPFTLTPDSDLNVVTYIVGTTVGATASPQTDDVVGVPDNDVWFTFTAISQSHFIKITNINAIVGTSYNLGIAVYDADAGCNNLVLNYSVNHDNIVVHDLTIGHQYLVRVYGFEQGNATAQVSFNIGLGTVASDNCALARDLQIYAPVQSSQYVEAQSTILATDSGIRASCINSSDAIRDFWYKVTVPPGQTGFKAIVTGMNYNKVNTALWESCGGNEVACHLQSYNNPQDAIFDGLTAEQTYYLQVWLPESYSGTYILGLEALPSSGVIQISVDDVSVFPNPTDNVLNINAKNTILSIQIFSIVEKEIMHITPNANKIQIKITKFKTGIYLARIITEDGKQSIKRVVIQNK